MVDGCEVDLLERTVCFDRGTGARYGKCTGSAVSRLTYLFQATSPSSSLGLVPSRVGRQIIQRLNSRPLPLRGLRQRQLAAACARA